MGAAIDKVAEALGIVTAAEEKAAPAAPATPTAAENARALAELEAMMSGLNG